MGVAKAEEVAAVDIVVPFSVIPGVFVVGDFEVAVWGVALDGKREEVGLGGELGIMGMGGRGLTREVGWGLGQYRGRRRTGRAVLEGVLAFPFSPFGRCDFHECIPNSTAQIPVPVPISRTLWMPCLRVSRGARYNLLLKVIKNN